jgi:hypothetical protein
MRGQARQGRQLARLGEKFIGHVAISYLRLFGTQGFQMSSA